MGSSAYERQSYRRGNGRKKESKTTKKEVKKESKMASKKQEKIEEKSKKSGTHPSRIRKVGKPTFEPLFCGRRRQAGNPLSERGYAGKIFFDFA